MDVRADRGQAHQLRNPLAPGVLAALSKTELRQRRRVGVDTARAQRRGYRAGRREDEA